MEHVVNQMRDFGVAFISNVPWGTHICGFYQEHLDYLETAIPYLETGLEHNEYCVWVIPTWLTSADAYALLKEKIPNFAQYQAQGQIKICTTNEWYLRFGKFEPHVLVQAWMKEYNKAMSGNWDGVRILGTPYWRGHRDWKSVVAYENLMEEKVGMLKLLVLCLYDITDLEIYQILDLASSHEFAFVKCDHDWKYSNKVAEVNQLNNLAKMVAGIVHEIRNPMTAVIALMQLLQGKEELQGYQNLFGSIIDEMHRANGIIAEYLSMVGQKQRTVQNRNLNQILHNLMPLIKAEASKQKKQVRFFPSEIDDIAVDEKEIRQVLLNLVHNGFEAMERDGILQIKTYMHNDNVVLEVQDDGHGIPPEVLHRLGQPFLTTKEGGTGLGLYVTFKILKFYHATVKVDSSPMGTTFSIAFPSVCGENQATPSTPSV